ncbi:MAG: DUF3563 domain-containing protein [Devosia sp.]
MSRLRNALSGPSRDDAERAYLNGAASRVDLEMREREISRGRFSHLSRRNG